jgi:polyhydroxyalkanoate synthase
MDAFGQAQFALLDDTRRARGNVLAALGFGPVECAYGVIASGPRWVLREYAGAAARVSVLIIAAPIKRPYIWDLAPPISAIGYLLAHGLGVHLLEWTPPQTGDRSVGLDDCVDTIATCLSRVPRDAGGASPVLIGHSLGGTLAAIFAAFDPRRVGGLVLLGAPLCFREGTSHFRDALVSIARSDPAETEVVPGSVLTHASALASPHAFVWSRLIDAAVSLADLQALDTHFRIARWALDEVALPGKLLGQILGWLYREDRFFGGTLPVKGRVVGPRDLVVPTLAVVDTADEIVPPAAVSPFLDASPAVSRLVEYPGEAGVALQHLALLVGRQARARVWPEIISWLKACR